MTELVPLVKAAEKAEVAVVMAPTEEEAPADEVREDEAVEEVSADEGDGEEQGAEVAAAEEAVAPEEAAAAEEEGAPAGTERVPGLGESAGPAEGSLVAPAPATTAGSLRAGAVQLLGVARERAAELPGMATSSAHAAGAQVASSVDLARNKASAALYLANLYLARLYTRTAETGAWAVDGTSSAVTQTCERTASLANTAAERCEEARRHAVDSAIAAAEAAKAKASEVRTGVCTVAADKRFQVSAASAASGAVALGTSGGAVGLTTGGAIGAAVGLVPALLTFGLSIPIGAAIGGGAGMAVGTAVGGAVGAVGGGAAGYGAYAKKEDIGRCAELVKAKAAETTELVRAAPGKAFGRAVEAADLTKAQAYASAGYVAGKASAARQRLVGGTGGTDTSD